MSDDKNDKAVGLFGNPLPIVMVVLLAAGVLVKTVPLESARPIDPERVKFVATSQQDVEARLWQDPFAAVEKHEEGSTQAGTSMEKSLMRLFSPPLKMPPAPHTPEALHERIQELHKNKQALTVVAVNVFGGSFNEAAEGRRRSRFAVVSALGFHGYHPKNENAIGYFHINLPETSPDKLAVPFEWFEKQDKSSNVLVLWLNEDKLSTTSRPLNELHYLFNELTPPDLAGGLRVKLIGPAGSGMLADLVRENTDPKKKPIALESGSTLEVFSPSATISNCDLLASVDKGGSLGSWDCFMKSPDLLASKELPIIRTTGTDDVLAVALLWELSQRSVNRKRAYKDQCKDGLVLIGERDTEYGRTLLRYLNDGFSKRCRAIPDGNYVTLRSNKPPVRTFSYLRGLDGVLPDLDKSGIKAPPKDDSSKSKDLRAQLEDAPPEHAEGRSQFDYLRRLADEIDRLDHDTESFAANGVKAIGIVGSDVYDKLIILQALRIRFKDKIFFTTDLDARYLHADQKDWARNLVVASNFGLSLRPALQYSTLPFRDSYQTATYLATLMALNPPFDWTGTMKDWLRPQIFEIGRTEAVHLASPSVKRLTEWIENDYSEIGQIGVLHLVSLLVERLEKWIKNDYSKDIANATCDSLEKCNSIEPVWPWRGLSLEHLPKVLVMLCLGILLVVLASRRVQGTLRTAYEALTSPRHAERRTAQFGLIGLATLVFAVLGTITIVNQAIDASLAQGIGEPFVWLEGVSVWPSLVLRFVGLVTMLVLALALNFWIRHHAKQISKDFRIGRPGTKINLRSWWSAMRTGPYLDLAPFDKKGNAKTKSEVKKMNAEEKIEVTALWRNYLRATSFREMAGWIMVSLLIGFVLAIVAFQVLGKPSFPHRGQLVLDLDHILVIFNALVLWLVIFWVGYETRACARFIETLSGARSLWPPVLLDREETATGVPRAHLDDYLDFQLIVRATQRIHWLIYLPFVGILFMVLSRSDLFDAMDFPLALLFVVGLALAYALHSAWLLRKSAESARVTALEHYETRLLTQARAKDSPMPAAADGAAANQARAPTSVEQIKILMEHIRDTRKGAFAPFAQQPALRALLLPFGGYGGVQLIEYLFKP